MGRQATPTIATTPEVQLDENGLNDVQQALAAGRAEYGAERDLVNQLLGQIQMSRAISKFTDVVSLQKLKHIKETKMYRALAGQKGFDRDGNEIADVGTFDGFCRALGTSASKVDEDLKNLSVFGEEALQQLTQIGAGYRELRQYRRLPEDQKSALIEAAKAGDKDGFLDLAEELISRHSRERDELEQRLTNVTADYEAQSEVLTGKDQKINELALDLRKAQRRIAEMPADEAAKQLRQEVSGYAYAAEAAIRGELAAGIKAIREAVPGADQAAFLHGLLLQVERAAAEVRAAYSIVAVDGDLTPAWMRPGSDAVVLAALEQARQENADGIAL